LYYWIGAWSILHHNYVFFLEIFLLIFWECFLI
jgi:hypothetical protein